MQLNGKFKSRNFTDDVVLGMTTSELMTKYGLSPEALQTHLKESLEAEAVSLVDSNLWSIWREEGITIEHFRLNPRHRLSFALPVFEENHPQNNGVVSDISRHGLRIRGLEAKSGDIRHLVIPGDGFFQASDLTLEAGCRWIGRDEIAETWVSGFFVIMALGGSWEEFQQLIEVVDT